jgi:hypothetical protein
MNHKNYRPYSDSLLKRCAVGTFEELGHGTEHLLVVHPGEKDAPSVYLNLVDVGRSTAWEPGCAVVSSLTTILCTLCRPGGQQFQIQKAYLRAPRGKLCE